MKRTLSIIEEEDLTIEEEDLVIEEEVIIELIFKVALKE